MTPDATALARLAVDTIRKLLLTNPPGGVSREEVELYFRLEGKALLRHWKQALAASAERACPPIRVYLGQTRQKSLITKLSKLGWGEATQPGELPARRRPYFFDCGAFRDWQAGTTFNGGRFARQLSRLAYAKEAGRTGELPDFIVLPDLPAQGKASLEMSRQWLENPPYGFRGLPQDGQHPEFPAPVYLVVQDGLTAEDVRPFFPRIGGLFVGGTVEWKRETIALWCQLAHDNGLQCHVGRAGSLITLGLAVAAGVDSIDTSLPLWSAENLTRFHHALCPAAGAPDPAAVQAAVVELLRQVGPDRDLVPPGPVRPPKSAPEVWARIALLAKTAWADAHAARAKRLRSQVDGGLSDAQWQEALALMDHYWRVDPVPEEGEAGSLPLAERVVAAATVPTLVQPHLLAMRNAQAAGKPLLSVLSQAEQQDLVAYLVGIDFPLTSMSLPTEEAIEGYLEGLMLSGGGAEPPAPAAPAPAAPAPSGDDSAAVHVVVVADEQGLWHPAKNGQPLATGSLERPATFLTDQQARDSVPPPLRATTFRWDVIAVPAGPEPLHLRAQQVAAALPRALPPYLHEIAVKGFWGGGDYPDLDDWVHARLLGPGGPVARRQGAAAPEGTPADGAGRGQEPVAPPAPVSSFFTLALRVHGAPWRLDPHLPLYNRVQAELEVAQAAQAGLEVHLMEIPESPSPAEGQADYQRRVHDAAQRSLSALNQQVHSFRSSYARRGAMGAETRRSLVHEISSLLQREIEGEAGRLIWRSADGSAIVELSGPQTARRVAVGTKDGAVERFGPFAGGEPLAIFTDFIAETLGLRRSGGQGPELHTGWLARARETRRAALALQAPAERLLQQLAEAQPDAVPALPAGWPPPGGEVAAAAPAALPAAEPALTPQPASLAWSGRMATWAEGEWHVVTGPDTKEILHFRPRLHGARPIEMGAFDTLAQAQAVAERATAERHAQTAEHAARVVALPVASPVRYVRPGLHDVEGTFEGMEARKDGTWAIVRMQLKDDKKAKRYLVAPTKVFGPAELDPLPLQVLVHEAAAPTQAAEVVEQDIDLITAYLRGRQLARAPGYLGGVVYNLTPQEESWEEPHWIVRAYFDKAAPPPGATVVELPQSEAERYGVGTLRLPVPAAEIEGSIENGVLEHRRRLQEEAYKRRQAHRRAAYLRSLEKGEIVVLGPQRHQTAHLAPEEVRFEGLDDRGDLRYKSKSGAGRHVYTASPERVHVPDPFVEQTPWVPKVEPEDPCTLLYVSPRERTLLAREARIRAVALELKHPDASPIALDEAAWTMAPCVRDGAVLVPIPDHTGNTTANLRLAEAIRRERESAGARVRVADLLARSQPDDSSMARRTSGQRGLRAEEHHLALRHPFPQDLDRRHVVFIDNVMVTGATFDAAALALGQALPGHGLAYAQAEPLPGEVPSEEEVFADIVGRVQATTQFRNTLRNTPGNARIAATDQLKPVLLDYLLHNMRVFKRYLNEPTVRHRLVERVMATATPEPATAAEASPAVGATDRRGAPAAPVGVRPPATNEPAHAPACLELVAWLQQIPGGEVTLRRKWSRPAQRQLFLDEMREAGHDLGRVMEGCGPPDADPLSLLCHLGWQLPIETRQAHQGRVVEAADDLVRLGGERWEILEDLLGLYRESAMVLFPLPDSLKIPSIADRWGNVSEISRRFGGPDAVRRAVAHLEELLYAPLVQQAAPPAPMVAAEAPPAPPPAALIELLGQDAARARAVEQAARAGMQDGWPANPLKTRRVLLAVLGVVGDEALAARIMEVLKAEGAPPDPTTAHYRVHEGRIYVDTWVLNHARAVPGVEVQHVGFGDFDLRTPRGPVAVVRRDSLTEEDFLPGQVGRVHEIYDNDAGARQQRAAQWFLDEMLLVHPKSMIVPPADAAPDALTLTPAEEALLAARAVPAPEPGTAPAPAAPPTPAPAGMVRWKGAPTLLVNGTSYLVGRWRSELGDGPTYELWGKRGARYRTIRNKNDPSAMFLAQVEGFGIPAQMEGIWLSDREGRLGQLHQGSVPSALLPPVLTDNEVTYLVFRSGVGAQRRYHLFDRRWDRHDTGPVTAERWAVVLENKHLQLHEADGSLQARWPSGQVFLPLPLDGIPELPAPLPGPAAPAPDAEPSAEPTAPPQGGDAPAIEAPVPGLRVEIRDRTLVITLEPRTLANKEHVQRAAAAAAAVLGIASLPNPRAEGLAWQASLTAPPLADLAAARTAALGGGGALAGSQAPAAAAPGLEPALEAYLRQVLALDGQGELPAPPDGGQGIVSIELALRRGSWNSKINRWIEAEGGREAVIRNFLARGITSTGQADVAIQHAAVPGLFSEAQPAAAPAAAPTLRAEPTPTPVSTPTAAAAPTTTGQGQTTPGAALHAAWKRGLAARDLGRQALDQPGGETRRGLLDRIGTKFHPVSSADGVLTPIMVVTAYNQGFVGQPADPAWGELPG